MQATQWRAYTRPSGPAVSSGLADFQAGLLVFPYTIFFTKEVGGAGAGAQVEKETARPLEIKVSY